MLCGLNAFVPTMEYYVGKDSKFGWQGIEGFKGMTVRKWGQGETSLLQLVREYFDLEERQEAQLERA